MPKQAQQKAELKQLSADQLVGELATLRANIVELRFEHANRALKDTSSIKKTRRSIAQILTAQRKK